MDGPKRQAIRSSHGFSLFAELMDAELPFSDLVLHLPAATSARLAQTNRKAHALLTDPAMARWCAESRSELLKSRNVPGDLTLAPEGCEWSLERLHLCEHPPRFPRIYFQFSDDALDPTEARKVERVAALLRRHPRLCIRVHGFAQPEAPASVGEALAQARATSVRARLLSQLAGEAAWADEDPADHGVGFRRGQAWFAMRLPKTKLEGTRLQAVGRWPHLPENKNFEAEGARELGGHHRLRCAEFTLTAFI